jgi:hypothetical protein
MQMKSETISKQIERLAYEKEHLRLALLELREMADEYPGPESEMFKIADVALRKMSDYA